MQLFNRKITKNGSLITSLTLESDAYSKNSLIIYFADSQLNDKKSLMDALKDIGGPETYMHNVYCVIPGNKAREVIGYLFSKQFIDNELRSDIEPFLFKLEKNLSYQNTDKKMLLWGKRMPCIQSLSHI